MWIVKLALDRPYTFAVMAILIALFGILSVQQMPVDIFPRINIPVLSAVWNFQGLPPQDMEHRVVTLCERAATTTVSGIEHIDSVSLIGMGVVKLYLHQDANMQEALSEYTAICQAILRQMPPGMTPPFITAFSAADVPVMQLCISSKTMPETKLFDFCNNFIRQQLATVQGAALPYPYGGSTRQVMVDTEPDKMAAKGVSASDVANSINAQNLILPAGTAKLGTTEYYVQMNSSPTAIDELNNIPIKQVGNAMVLMKDVAHVHDGLAVQTNIVNQDGSRAILMNIIKIGGASTIDVVNRVKAQMPAIKNILPEGVNVRILNDQSIFVSEAVNDVVREGLTAAALTALLMLLLLGDWKSTVIVAVSIPLSVLSGLILLRFGNQTINTMTLGGFALAVGMLVDDATVEVENIHRHLDLIRHHRQEAAMSETPQQARKMTARWVRQGILEAADEIAVPAFVSTVAICIVFAPVLFLTEPAKSMFAPLALAVVGSMMSSYFLSRTVVPVMSKYMLAGHADPSHGVHEFGTGIIDQCRKKFHQLIKAVDRGFENIRRRYQATLELLLARRIGVMACVIAFMAVSLSLIPFLGEDFFPAMDGVVLRMHVSAPRGTRIEETETIFKRIENELRQLFPAGEIEAISDNIGIPNSGLNLSSSDAVNYTAADGEIYVTLPEHHKNSGAYYRNLLRDKLPKLFLDCIFFFQPADMVTRILNAGLAAPIDIQVRSLNAANAYTLASEIQRKVATIPGAVDVHIKQSQNGPTIKVDVDRQKAAMVGFTQRDVAGSMLVSLSSSFQTGPNFWVNPKNGVNYAVAVQTPQREIATMGDLANTVVTSSNHGRQLLGNLANFSRATMPTVVNHINAQPVVDVLASVEGTDLNSVAQKVRAIVDSYKGKLPHAVFLDLKGQMTSMDLAYSGLLSGMVFALVLVYLLLVVNFQSWIDPLIILMAIPGALCGICWALFLTQTTFSVPALMGAIMSIGVASANSILVVSFAREKLAEGRTALEAALEAGATRFRPVLMTAAAMIIGMLPMALGTGSGGSQNAPLGRAVIGGLIIATFFTLIWVPLVFSFVHRHAEGRAADQV